MTQSLDDLGQQLLDAAKSAGASAADALAAVSYTHLTLPTTAIV